jgi:hypothetical protein
MSSQEVSGGYQLECIGKKKLHKYVFSWNASSYPGIEQYRDIIKMGPRTNLCKCMVGVVYLNKLDVDYVIDVLKMQEISISVLNHVKSPWILRIMMDHTIFSTELPDILTKYIKYFVDRYKENDNIELYIIRHKSPSEPVDMMRTARLSHLISNDIHTFMSIDMDSVISPIRLLHMEQFSNSPQLVYRYEMMETPHYSLTNKIMYDDSKHQFYMSDTKTIKHYAYRVDLYDLMYQDECDEKSNYPNMLAGLMGTNFMFIDKYYESTLSKSKKDVTDYIEKIDKFLALPNQDVNGTLITTLNDIRREISFTSVLDEIYLTVLFAKIIRSRFIYTTIQPNDNLFSLDGHIDDMNEAKPAVYCILNIQACDKPYTKLFRLGTNEYTRYHLADINEMCELMLISEYFALGVLNEANLASVYCLANGRRYFTDISFYSDIATLYDRVTKTVNRMLKLWEKGGAVAMRHGTDPTIFDPDSTV